MRFLLVGSKPIGLAAMRRMQELDILAGVVTLADSDDSRSRLHEFQAAGATVVSQRSEALAAMRAVDADGVLVAGWYWLIPSDLLAERPHIGIHHSLLPEFRGGSPLVWSMIRGAKTVGTSIFSLTDEVDAGDIWAQASVAIRADDYIGDVVDRCDSAAIELLPSILAPAVQPRPQDHARATWCAQRRPEDGAIDWTRPADEVTRWIRAQSKPYPGAFSWAGDVAITFWRARAEAITYVGMPGQLVSIDGSVAVVCGDDRPVVVEESSGRLVPGMRLSLGLPRR